MARGLGMHRAMFIADPENGTLTPISLHRLVLSKSIGQTDPHRLLHICASQATNGLTFMDGPIRFLHCSLGFLLHRTRPAAVSYEQGAWPEKSGAQLPFDCSFTYAVERAVIGVPAGKVEVVGGFGGADGEPVVVYLAVGEEGVDEGEKGEEEGEEIALYGGTDPVEEAARKGGKIKDGAAVSPC